MTHKRIGFCCKWLDFPRQMDGFKPKDEALKLNNRTTTVAWLNRQERAVAEQRLWDIMEHNTNATLELVKRVGTLDPRQRMVRLSSDMFPVYTEPTYSYYYQLPDVKEAIAKKCAAIGETARMLDIRVSFHPGQFCVLASDNETIVANSIREFEYHTDLARWMGYGNSFHDHGFKINVHISGRKGPDGIRAIWNQLSTEARNLVTIENEENSYGLDDTLSLADIIPTVFDCHHHWVKTGEYIEPTDDKIKRVIDSWRGVRPTMHYSVSSESILVGHDNSVRPAMTTLLESGHKKQKLRAHSDFMWNTAVNQYVAEFWENFDIQVESKAKNLASTKLFQELTNA
ncbi:UV damage endonuclease UvsE [bacterium]|nr:UV damage endonuclease UvsE [bacterium]